MSYSELDGVNRLLALTGEAPVTSLAPPQSSSVAAARVALEYARKGVCNEPTLWNEEKQTVTPDTGDNYAVRFGADVVNVLPTEPYEQHRFVLRGNQLWDTVLTTGSFDPANGWPVSFEIRVLRILPFEQCPSAVQAYIIAKALVSHAGGTGDATLMGIANQEMLDARVAYDRWRTPPGRYGMLDKQSAQYFTRLRWR